MNLYNTFKTNNKNKGFVVLISIIIVTIVATLGAGILNIALKDLIISNFQKEATKALFASDAGIDCAVGYDTNNPMSLFSAFSNSFQTTTDNIKCNGIYLEVTSHVSSTCNGNPCIITTLFAPSSSLLGQPLELGNGSCVFIEIQKINTGVLTEDTIITSRGISSCTGSRRLERTSVLKLGSP